MDKLKHFFKNYKHIFWQCLIVIIIGLIIFHIIVKYRKQLTENFQNVGSPIKLTVGNNELNFNTINIDNKILGSFLESGDYNNYTFKNNQSIFNYFTSDIINKINNNLFTFTDNYDMFSIISAEKFIGYCDTTDSGNKCYYMLKNDADIGNYVILSDYIIDVPDYGYLQFRATNYFNADTQFLAVNKKYIDTVIPEYIMQNNAVNIYASNQNLAVKVAVPGYVDVASTNFIGKTMFSDSDISVIAKSYSSIYKLNQLFYDIIQTNYITTMPTASFKELNNYVYITIKLTNATPIYLTYDSTKVDTTLTVLDCLSVDQTLPRLKVLPVQVLLPNNTNGIAYLVPAGVNNNIFDGVWMLGIESINMANIPIKLYKQYELLPNMREILQNGGIHNLGYPFFVFDIDNFSISKYICQQLPSSFGIDSINKKILHLAGSNTVNIVSIPVFNDIKYKFPGVGLKVYFNTYTYVNNILYITSVDTFNNNAIDIAWNYTGLQCLLPKQYIVSIDTTIKTIIIDNMQFIVHSANKWSSSTTEYILCIIKEFSTTESLKLFSPETQTVTVPLTTKVSSINTPTVYIPNEPTFNFQYDFTTILPETATSTTMPPITSTTMPPITSTTMPPVTSTTMPPVTSTTTKYITANDYDKIIQQYRGTVAYPLRIPIMQNKKYNTTTQIQTTTTKPIQLVSDDIINYYGNLIVDKEGINSLIQNKYIDDLLK